MEESPAIAKPWTEIIGVHGKQWDLYKQHDDQAKIGMILAPISDSFSLILGHFPVFNVLKLSVSGFIRFQE